MDGRREVNSRSGYRRLGGDNQPWSGTGEAAAAAAAARATGAGRTGASKAIAAQFMDADQIAPCLRVSSNGIGNTGVGIVLEPADSLILRGSLMLPCEPAPRLNLFRIRTLQSPPEPTSGRSQVRSEPNPREHDP